jgi:two-component system cell cycle sensor histidine kinase/response regulator CckA
MQMQKKCSGAAGCDIVSDVLNSISSALIDYKPSGEFQMANRKAFDLFAGLGLPDSPLATFRGLIDFVYDHSLDVQDQENLFAEENSESGSQTIFQDMVGVDGDKIFLVQASLRKGGDIIVTFTDISLMKKKADAVCRLSTQNRNLIEAIEASPNGVFIAEQGLPGEPITFVNAAFCRMTGLSSESLTGRPMASFLEEVFPDGGKEAIAALQKGEMGNVWAALKDGRGQPIWQELQVFSLPGSAGHHLAIGFLFDQTREKLQESQMLQSKKLEAIGQLAGGVAHDFNNILSIIEGYSRLAENGIKKGEDISESIKKIRGAVQRGSGLTRQLLTFGKHRIAADRVVNLCAVLRDVEALLYPLMGARVDLTVDVPREALCVETTPDEISQIVMNLAVNARDAMPDGGEVRVSLSCLSPAEKLALGKDAERMDGDIVCLRVSDSGTGMDAATLEKIFDPFFTTKEQGKGTGLGLSLVYGLVRQMKGWVDVTSKVGSGTNFSIYLPRSRKSVEDDAGSLEQVAGGDLAGKTILVAEDEPDLLAVMQATLHEMGMKVLCAKDGDEAIVLQDEFDGKIDFLLTDVVMPGMSGLHLAELMREARPETEIVYMSGYPVRGEVASVEIPEDSVFLAKPVPPEKLRVALSNLTNTGARWETGRI